MKENAYEMPWRTNYEAMAVAGWLVGATGAMGTWWQLTMAMAGKRCMRTWRNGTSYVVSRHIRGM